QKACVDVDRSVRKCERIRDGIAQRAKLPFDVFELRVGDDGRSDACEIRIQTRIVIDHAIFFETLVEQVDFAQQFLVDFAKLELFLGNLRYRGCLLRFDARCPNVCGQGGKNQADYK